MLSYLTRYWSLCAAALAAIADFNWEENATGLQEWCQPQSCFKMTWNAPLERGSECWEEGTQTTPETCFCTSRVYVGPFLGYNPFFSFVISGQPVWDCDWCQHRMCCEAGRNQLHPLPCQQQRPATYLGENAAKINVGAGALLFRGVLLYSKQCVQGKQPYCARCICSLVLF